MVEDLLKNVRLPNMLEVFQSAVDRILADIEESNDLEMLRSLENAAHRVVDAIGCKRRRIEYPAPIKQYHGNPASKEDEWTAKYGG